MAGRENQDEPLTSVGVQNVTTIDPGQGGAEQELLRTQEALRESQERLRAVDEQRANDEQLRAMFNQAAVGMAIVALDGTFLDTNLRFAEILGYSGEELRSRSFRELTHPQDLRATQVAIDALVNGETSSFSLEKQYIRKDGAVVWSLTSVTLLRDAAGQPQRYLDGDRGHYLAQARRARVARRDAHPGAAQRDRQAARREARSAGARAGRDRRGDRS